MVKDLKGDEDTIEHASEEKKPLPVGEELESTMTHQEIEAYSQKYSLKWQ